MYVQAKGFSLAPFQLKLTHTQFSMKPQCRTHYSVCVCVCTLDIVNHIPKNLYILTRYCKSYTNKSDIV